MSKELETIVSFCICIIGSLVAGFLFGALIVAMAERKNFLKKRGYAVPLLEILESGQTMKIVSIVFFGHRYYVFIVSGLADGTPRLVDVNGIFWKTETGELMREPQTGEFMLETTTITSRELVIRHSFVLVKTFGSTAKAA